MADYRLGPVIGKIGGGVEKIPVEAVADGARDSVVVMHAVHVPEGETWLVVLSGDLDPRYNTTSNGPELSIGEVTFGPGLPTGRFGGAAEVTGTAEIALKRNNFLATDSFDGHVYFAPLP